MCMFFKIKGMIHIISLHWDFRESLILFGFEFTDKQGVTLHTKTQFVILAGWADRYPKILIELYYYEAFFSNASVNRIFTKNNGFITCYITFRQGWITVLGDLVVGRKPQTPQALSGRDSACQGPPDVNGHDLRLSKVLGSYTPEPQTFRNLRKPQGWQGPPHVA